MWAVLVKRYFWRTTRLGNNNIEYGRKVLLKKKKNNGKIETDYRARAIVVNNVC